MVLIIDNYDSFVYNIIHFLELRESEYLVVRNDKIKVDEIEAMIDEKKINAIIISPGPMAPNDAGVSNDIIKSLHKKIPILGVCLGHECIGQVFNCKIERCKEIIHGEADDVYIIDSPIYKHLNKCFKAARYHSLCISRDDFNHEKLIIDAQLSDGTIMGVRHRIYPLFGVQYHPESILTGENGKAILKSFIEFSKDYNGG